MKENRGRTGIAETLLDEPKVTVVIPVKNEKERYWEGGINGRFFRVERGVPVEAPESLARLIRTGAAAQTLAGEETRAYRGGGRRLG